MKAIQYSPLFWPVELKRDAIHVLDETLLPDKVKYLKVKSCRESCRAIQEMKTRAVGQVILVMYTFLLVIRQNRTPKNISSRLAETAKALNVTRPTLSFKYLTDLVLSWDKNGRPLEKWINGFLENLKKARINQARETAGLLADGDVILTHCNVSGLLPLIAAFCKQRKKRIAFFATETRPYLQGARLTAWELERFGFKVTLIGDSMVAQVMQEGKINAVIVGADNLARNGDIANKIGTYQIALLAKHFNIPFYVLCPPASGAQSGTDIKIEIRPDKELLNFGGKRIAPRGVKGYYPAFDITPAALITQHIHLGV